MNLVSENKYTETREFEGIVNCSFQKAPDSNLNGTIFYFCHMKTNTIFSKCNFFLLVLLTISWSAAGQAILYTEAPLFDNSTSTGRGPNGSAGHVFMRGCALVKASELTGIAPNSTLSTFGFTLNSGASVNAPTGNFTVYLQNTADVTYNKGTSFTTAIGGMSTAFIGAMTIPISAGSTSVTVTLTTPFVYTGGGIYVAYDWYNPGPYSSALVVYRCNSGGLSPGCATNAGAGLPASDALGTTAFRPCFLFGAVNTLTNEISVRYINATGRLANIAGLSNTVTAQVRNYSNQTRTNIPVTLNVTGANPYTSTQTITTLAAGATSQVSFNSFLPTTGGLNILSVSIPADQNNTNNSAVYMQSVTCNEWALSPAVGNYTNAVGFNTGSGIIAVAYQSPATLTLSAIRGSVSNNLPSVGNSSWAVLLNSSGNILATTNTVTISNADLGTFLTYSFTNPPVLSPSTNYYFGLAQPTGTAGYFPLGTFTGLGGTPFTNFVTTTTVGGTPAPLTSDLGYPGLEAIFTPTLPIAVSAPASVICGSAAVLSATTAASYTWTGGPANSNYTVNPTSNTIYSLNALSAFGCAGSATLNLMTTPIQVTATPATSICAGLAVILSAGGASSYTWNTVPPQIQSFLVDIPATNTVYVVTGGNPDGCTATVSVNVTVNAKPTIALSSQTLICGNTATLIAGTIDSYTWTGGPANTNLLVTPSVSTVYSVTAVNNFSCTATQTVGVTLSALSLSLSPATPSVCQGNSVVITAQGATSYTAAGQFLPSNTFTVSPQVNTTYTVFGYKAPGCPATSTVQVAVLQNPIISFTPQTVNCGVTTTLSVMSDAPFVWASGPANAGLVVTTPTAGAAYSVTATNSVNCSTGTLVPLMVTPVTVTASPSNTAICIGNNLTLTAGGALNYTWTALGYAVFGASATPAPSVTTTYSVIGMGLAPGCTDTETVQVTVNALPDVQINASAAALCVGQTLTLTATGASSYEWNDASTGMQLVFTPTLATFVTFSVTGTDGNSCVKTASTVIEISACVGIQEVSGTNGLLVFPNPFRSQFTIRFANESSNCQLRVLNALGQEILFLTDLKRETTLDLQAQPNGLYFVFCSENGRPLDAVRVVKE